MLKKIIKKNKCTDEEKKQLVRNKVKNTKPSLKKGMLRTGFEPTIYELLFFVAHNPLGHVRIQQNYPIFLYIIVISKPADNYLRAAHYLLYLLSLNGRAGQITRETNYLWVTIVTLILK